MANVLSMGNLFPPELVKEMVNTVRGKSSLARLSDRAPVSFTGNTIATFAMDKEVDLVAENGAKSNGGGTLTPVSMQPVKIEYGMRVSDEFKHAAEEQQLEYLRAFAEGWAAKAARGLDIMAFHGINPRTGADASVLNAKSFNGQGTLVTNSVTATTDADADVTSAIALVESGEHDVTGMAMAPAFRTALASLKKSADSNEALFPELAWGSAPSTINGLPVDVNSTVAFGGSQLRAIVGNFRDYFRWGYADQMPIEIIEYGNPDNDAEAGDLKGHNQIYLRGEMYLSWGILVPGAFAKIVAE